ncbi:hypothetical protein V6N12_013829 [Hibiscus sabdariffa]|uniref:Uncharacterized protein n=1 Tax=Hibiscus sabdariffa TaxID=183260 RepID=A0ABR2B7C9_9ROSI
MLRLFSQLLQDFKMKLSLSSRKLVHPRVNLGLNLERVETFFRRKDKVVFVMGATGTGKSRLAINLATRFPAEIVNSDKMQVYKGLNILTNKVTEEECRDIPHHLLGIVDPNSNFTSMDFQRHASLAIGSIVANDRLPIVTEAPILLHSFVSERVDRMVQAGLLDEVSQMFDPVADYSRGIRRAIGVPELDQYFRGGSSIDAKIRARMLDTAISKIKENTCNLASRQLQKILRLYNQWNWRMHRIDATEVFLKSHNEGDETWERLVVGPSTMIVEQFLYEKKS